MKTRNEYLVNTKADLVKNLDVYLEGVKDNQVMVVRKNISLEKAKEDIKKYIDEGKIKEINIDRKIIKKLKTLIGKASIHQEYYNVIGSLFHVSSVEFSYNYYLNGNLISINPHVYNTNIDINVFESLFDGGYYYSLTGNEKTENTDYNSIETSEIVNELEDGFLAHTISNVEYEYDQKRSMKILRKNLISKLKDLKDEELGKSRKINSINLVDYKYDYSTVVFVVPFYVFNFDTGKETVTITYNAYNGQISEPICNNPLAILEYALKEGTTRPSFNIFFFILSFVVIILGPVCYILNYLFKIAKFNRDIAKSLPYSEQIKLM